MVTYVVQYKYVSEEFWQDAPGLGYESLQEAAQARKNRLESEDVYRYNYPEYADSFMEFRVVSREEKVIEL